MGQVKVGAHRLSSLGYRKPSFVIFVFVYTSDLHHCVAKDLYILMIAISILHEHEFRTISPKKDQQNFSIE